MKCPYCGVTNIRVYQKFEHTYDVVGTVLKHLDCLDSDAGYDVECMECDRNLNDKFIVDFGSHTIEEA